ncbi:hypothetical protein TSAR_001049, partial [Trichomalopsis sarcophagae]
QLCDETTLGWTVALTSTIVTIAVCSGFTRHGIVSLIDRAVDHVQINVKPYQVTLITESSEVLSPASQLVTKRVVGEFRSLVLGMSELARIENQQLSCVKRSVASFFTRSTMKIMIPDTADENTLLMELIDFLDEFFAFCLIFLINKGRGLNLKEFFRYSWNFKFAYISVVELSKRDDKRTVIMPMQYAKSYTVIHQYNSSVDAYKKKRFSSFANLFPKSTRNLYGQVMRVGFLDTFPQVMFHKSLIDCNKDVWSALYGLDVLISQILASTLNFSIKVALINSGHKDLSCLNVPSTSFLDLFLSDDLDYFVNFYYLSGRIPMSNYDVELMTFLYYDSVHMVIKQYGFAVVECCHLIFVLLLMIFIKVMKIGDETWTIYNLLPVAIGNSVKMGLDNSTRRVIFITRRL